jgi:hypothetical protein
MARHEWCNQNIPLLEEIMFGQRMIFLVKIRFWNKSLMVDLPFFDFPYGGTNVTASSYINAANTNLFYMNNIMHDVWYQYGFDEANGISR